jgi:beta-glucosidase
MRFARPVSVALGSLVLASWATAPQAAPLTDAQVQEKVDGLLAQMTLEEKVGQLTQVGAFPGMEPAETLRNGGAGSVLWLNDPAESNELQRIAVEETRLGIPVLFALDVIHGYQTIFPVPLAMAASWDPAGYERAQAVAAREARAAGIHWTFGPMLDIARDARWGRMIEGAGEDPYLGAAMAAAQVRGFQGPHLGAPEHLVACAKHYAGYGASDGGRDYDPVYLPESALRNVYLPPFRAAAEAGVGTFMSAYMDLNDVPATANHFLLRQVLRDEWGFEGFVVSDAFGVANLVTQGFARDGEDAARRALAAGLDMDMASGTFGRHLTGVLKRKEVPMERLDEAVRSILAVKVRMGLFENPYVDESKLAGVLASPAHGAEARRAAQRSMVLLRNEDQTLPLPKDRGPIAVIGPVADSKADTEGSWLVFGHEAAAVTVLEGIRAAVAPGIEVTYAKGPNIKRTIPSFFEDLIPGAEPQADQTPEEAEATFQQALETARAAETVVMVLGETAYMSGEAASRASLDLPGRQQELLEAVVALEKKVVLVLVNGRPLTIPWAAENVPAILEAWQPGSEGGHAVADILFGDANPGGKLPVTFPRHSAHAPLYYARNLTHQPESSDRYRSRYWDGPTTPLYPFGHGLSYTTFSYSNLRLEKPAIAVGESTAVSIDVANSGAVAGDEVVQLYVHQRWGSDSRPMRELEGFERIHLAPGESRTVQFTLGPDQLGYWSTAKGGHTQDEAAFDVWVGGESTVTEPHAELWVGVERPAPAAQTVPVAVTGGLVTGVVEDGVASFKGIPYAAPPLGELRWRAPQPPAPWEGTRAADAYANDCMQNPFPSDAAPLGTPPAEDCLYLNVWTPAEPSDVPLPVMVWIHGGGFVNGGSSPAVYDGSPLARKGVVFVSMNYRLGRFGFFAHPALSKEQPSAPLGNYGFLDQIAALEWVKGNVAAFGGDPGNVTLFGESAGGGSVNALMTSPLAEGLFHKAIVESGGGRSRTLISMRPLREAAPDGRPSAEAVGVAFAEQAGLTGDDAAVLAGLRALPADELVNGLNLMNQQPDTFAGPILDGRIVPTDVEEAFRAGRQARIPYLIGANDLEFGFFPTPPERTDELLAAFGPDREKAIAAYDPEGSGDKGLMGMRIMSDLAMVEPARMLARLTTAAGQPTWVYRFSYVASSLRPTARGALHATEIPFVLGTVRAKYGDATTAEDEAVADVASAYWAAFARAGDPNGEGRPEWPAYDPVRDVIMDFTLEGPEAGPDPFKARLDLVERLAEVSRP